MSLIHMSPDAYTGAAALSERAEPFPGVRDDAFICLSCEEQYAAAVQDLEARGLAYDPHNFDPRMKTLLVIRDEDVHSIKHAYDCDEPVHATVETRCPQGIHDTGFTYTGELPL